MARILTIAAFAFLFAAEADAGDRPKVTIEVLKAETVKLRLGCLTVQSHQKLLKTNWRKRVRVERTDDIRDAVRRF